MMKERLELFGESQADGFRSGGEGPIHGIVGRDDRKMAGDLLHERISGEQQFDRHFGYPSLRF
jgi:hypothetical protein